ncbi:MAG: adenylyltransferase/cytidyltransferase family protein [Mycobacterium sp.]|nr:adenylyltransferase/cytidyltransferase family protein [Mycobacterium sp.]
MSVIYCFDIDGTLCTPVLNSDYASALPRTCVVEEINRLYDAGNVVKIMTARGCVSGEDHTELTRRQLAEWGVKYHELIMNTKPHAHLFVDDRAINVEDWLAKIPLVRGVVAGAFDVIHPGYVQMLAEAKRICTHLTVALHSDPSAQRRSKLKPVFSVEDRAAVLAAIRFVDAVVTYETEDDLYEILRDGCFQVRFLGDDYKSAPITGADLNIPIHWIDRSHGHSTTKTKMAIHDNVAKHSDS